MTPATKLTEADREALREARAKSPAALQARIASLSAENERLRALVETGYEEGWEDATCQPMGFDANWNHSKTRAALQPKEVE